MKKVSFRDDILPLKNMLYRLALRITLDSAESEDIVQDTLIRVWNRREHWDEIDSIEAFSITVCRNLALDRAQRHSAHNASLDDTPTETPDTARDPYERTQQIDRVHTVQTIVNGLPEKQRTCMQLRDFEGKSYKEIAAALQISEEQVKVNIFRARQAVKTKFKQIDEYGL